MRVDIEYYAKKDEVPKTEVFTCVIEEPVYIAGLEMLLVKRDGTGVQVDHYIGVGEIKRIKVVH